MLRHLSHSILIVLAALCVLAMGSSAQHVDLSISLISTGNAAPVGAGQIGPETILAVVNVPETAWQWTARRTAADVDWGVVRGAFREEKRWMGAMSRETVVALQAITDSNRPAPEQPQDLGLTYSTVAYQAVDAALPVTVGPWTAYLQGSVLIGNHFETLSGTGQAYSGVGKTVHFHLQTTEKFSKSGSGWSVGGGITYSRHGHRIRLDARDVVGRLVWSDGVVRRGVVNSNNLVRDGNGYPSFAPLTQGTWSAERLVSTPLSRWSLGYDYVGRGDGSGQTPIASLQLESFDRTLLQISGTLALSPELAATLGFLYPAPGVLIGMRWNALSISLAFEPLQWWCSRTFALQANFNLTF